MLKRHDYILRSIERGYIVTGKAEQIEMFLDADTNEEITDDKINKYSIEDFDVERLKIAIFEDIAVLEEVLSLVEPIHGDVARDEKFKVLINEVIKKYGKEKILIFSEFSDPVNFLHRELTKRYSNIVINRISSQSANSAEKTSIIRRFSPRAQKVPLSPYDKEIQYLITTDVLSEGQNLQDAHIVVNYDFHWNPVRLIQRIGRVDRIGGTGG